MKLRNIPVLPALVITVMVAALAFLACGGSSNKSSSGSQGQSDKGSPAAQSGGGSQPSAKSLFPSPADPPDPKSIPSTFNPQPGGLYFVTNTSIAYNSTSPFPWIIMIDAKTKKIVAGAQIPEMKTSPHGIGVSPDGKQAYLPAGSVPASLTTTAPDGSKFAEGVVVVDMKTLKATQSIGTMDRPHHIQVLNDQYMMVDAWGVDQVLFLLDPNEGNKKVKEIAAKPFDGRPYIAFPSPDGKYIYYTVRPNQGSNSTDSWLSRLEIATWKVEKVVDLPGEGAVWTAFGRDGKYIYVTVPGEDRVAKIDMLATPPKVVGTAATGRGPYGVNLSADETTLFVVSKGEGGRGQNGGSFVTIDAETMRVLKEVPACLAFLCQPDHANISPDGTEFWISNNMGYISIFDAKTLALKVELTMPFLSDPHGGVFVQYDRDGKGHVVGDPGGPRGGVSPYPFDNQNGVPTLADALKDGWKPAKSSSALALGAKPGSAQKPATGPKVTLNLSMNDFYFDPLPTGTSVAPGSVVTFKMTNKGQAVHNVTSDNTTRIANGLRLGIKQVDVDALKTAELTFTAPANPGTYKFTCTYHPQMDGELVVK